MKKRIFWVSLAIAGAGLAVGGQYNYNGSNPPGQNRNFPYGDFSDDFSAPQAESFTPSQSQSQNAPLFFPDTFGSDLSYGLTHSTDVELLQEFLIVRGLYQGPVTGNFFILTLDALKRFQSSQGLTQTGKFDRPTRDAANALVRRIVGDQCFDFPCDRGNLAITTGSSLRAAVGRPFSASFFATGGTGNYSFQFDRNPIPGLDFARRGTNELILSGSPTRSGTFALGITITDTRTGASFFRTFAVSVSSSDGDLSGGTFFVTADRISGSAPLAVTFTAVLRNYPSCGLTYSWDFGDGTTRSVSETCPGEPRILAERSVAITHVYSSAGNFIVKFTLNQGGAFVPVSVR